MIYEESVGRRGSFASHSWPRYLVGSLPQDRSWHVEGLRGSCPVIPAQVEAVDENNSVIPISREVEEGVRGWNLRWNHELATKQSGGQGQVLRVRVTLPVAGSQATVIGVKPCR